MRRKPTQSGFTLIEMIVSLGVFSLVITIAVGALLTLMASSKRLQGEQSVMTNLSFALDGMTREIRTGSFYFCDSAGSDNGPNNIFNPTVNLDSRLGNNTQDCPNGANGNGFHGLAFKEGGDSITASEERILYYFNQSDQMIYRRVGSAEPQSIVSSGIVVKRLEFIVTGSQKLTAGGNSTTDQPAVTIFIEAAETADPTSKSYYLQTTVEQRTLDL